MGSSAHNGNIEKVVEALTTVGDMTALEVAAHCKITRDTAASLLSLLRTETPRRPQRAHICDWTYDAEGTSKPYPRPVYRIGQGKDAPKPKPKTDAQKSRDHRAALRAQNRSVSVFNLAAGYRSPAAAERRRELDALRPPRKSHKKVTDAG